MMVRMPSLAVLAAIAPLTFGLPLAAVASPPPTHSSYVATSSTSTSPTGPTRPATPAGQVWIGGQPTAGHTWLARTSGWPARTTFAYEWDLDGQPIPGATSSSYRAPGSAFNHLLSLTVTGTAPGYASTPFTTQEVRVQGYNPLAGDQWPADLTPPSVDGNYWDRDLVQSYLAARTTSRTLQGSIATRPRATWFGGWDSATNQANLVRRYIASVQNGNPHALVQLTLHTIWTIDRLSEDDRVRPLTSAQQSDYKAWMTAVANAIGTSRVAIIMEPDLALLPKSMSGEVNTADPIVRVRLVAWATQLLARNPNAAIYLDSGDSDWQHVATMEPWLKLAGIQYARGFALGATHYSKAQDDIAYGTAMVRALAADGLPGKHYVIDTADNGQGFTWGQYAATYGGGSFNNAAPCTTTAATVPCASLGVPPTWQVVDSALPLTAAQKFYALRQVDGFLWFSRPWLPWQSGAYSVALAQRLASSSPYA